MFGNCFPHSLFSMFDITSANKAEVMSSFFLSVRPSVCVSFCRSVSRITEKVLSRFH